ncbi:hypothetical protein [Deinococcus arenicola]|uniref:Uncharacterized protein n=1 Tax=Deinococcus arenicola TaxID=2994950 RepID=A0ABU4DUN8_9DEIO|nr:hypothetical protein [Deinococcus sp. ZS9-10]MDV6376125.1 hypothetical protein [Deinococcus sp. ZS9-10]
MGILWLLLGASVTVCVLLFVLALPLAWARGAAVLAVLALIAVLGSILFAPGSLERGFGAVYLILGLLAAVVLSLPRLLKYAGLEPVWVGLGLGMVATLLLIGVGMGVDATLKALLPPPDPQTGISVKAQILQGLSNGILFAAPVVVVVLSWLGWRGRITRRVF